MDSITDFTAMSRDEIRDTLTAAIGDDELHEDAREALVLKLEDLDEVTPDEFWAAVEAASGAQSTDTDAESRLNAMTASELRKLAADLEVPGRSKMKKAELVAAIEVAQIAARSVELFEQAEKQTRRLGEVAILRDAPGRAIVTAAFDGRTVGGSIVRTGRRYLLTAGTITIKANSFEKIAKLFAKRLGFRADVIDIGRTVC